MSQSSELPIAAVYRIFEENGIITSRECVVLSRRHTSTLKQIGLELNVSQTYIRDVEAHAVKKILAAVARYKTLLAHVPKISQPPRRQLGDEPLWRVVHLSVRARNALCNEGIDTLSQLASMTEKEVLGMSMIGIKVLNELREVLSLHGLTFSTSN